MQPYLDELAVLEWQAALRVPRPARRPRRTTADSGPLPLFDDAQAATR